MKKYESGAKNEVHENIRIVEDCLRDIRNLLRKKSLNFKVNKECNLLIEDTQTALDEMRKHCKTIK